MGCPRQARDGGSRISLSCRTIGRWLIALGILSLCLGARPAAADVIEGHAFVRGDGSLWINNRVVVLFGVYLPPTDRQCRAWINPVRCDPRSVLALDDKVRGFITCLPQGEDGDGRIHAICYVGRTGLNPGEDLGAYLIQWGWALALPNAPFEYQALERIAQTRGLGVWGYFVDSVTEQRRR